MLTSLDSGTEPLNLTVTDLQFVLPHIAEPFIDRAQKQQQAFEIDIPDVPLTTITDFSYLGHCVTELLNNACKYTPAGETIRLSVELTSKTINISVSNYGVEIPEIERDRIFDKFYRIPNNDPWKYGGTGLGLALVKKMVHRLGGTISVLSYVDDNQVEQRDYRKLTTLTIHLPLKNEH